MKKRKIKKTTKTTRKKTTKTTRKKTIRRNPLEANVDNLQKGKYYIVEHTQYNRSYPNYRIFVFDYYSDIEIIGKHPNHSKQNIYVLYDEIDKIYGPFSSISETLDYAERLKKGNWIGWPYVEPQRFNVKSSPPKNHRLW